MTIIPINAIRMLRQMCCESECITVLRFGALVYYNRSGYSTSSASIQRVLCLYSKPLGTRHKKSKPQVYSHCSWCRCSKHSKVFSRVRNGCLLTPRFIALGLGLKCVDQIGKTSVISSIRNHQINHQINQIHTTIRQPVYLDAKQHFEML